MTRVDGRDSSGSGVGSCGSAVLAATRAGEGAAAAALSRSTAATAIALTRCRSSAVGMRLRLRFRRRIRNIAGSCGTVLVRLVGALAARDLFGISRVAGFADAIRARVARLVRPDDADAFLVLVRVDVGKLVVAVAERPEAHVVRICGRRLRIRLSHFRSRRPDGRDCLARRSRWRMWQRARERRKVRST